MNLPLSYFAGLSSNAQIASFQYQSKRSVETRDSVFTECSSSCLQIPGFQNRSILAGLTIPFVSKSCSQQVLCVSNWRQTALRLLLAAHHTTVSSVKDENVNDSENESHLHFQYVNGSGWPQISRKEHPNISDLIIFKSRNERFFQEKVSGTLGIDGLTTGKPAKTIQSLSRKSQTCKARVSSAIDQLDDMMHRLQELRLMLRQ